MKKLMFAAAVMACIGLNAEITSQNVVGYLTANFEDGGYRLVAPTFTTVSGDPINLQDIKLIDASGDGTEKICLINAQGMDDGEYTWYGSWAPQGEGWYDGFSLAEGITLIKGQGYYMYKQSGDLKVQTSGQVEAGEIVFDIPQGYNIVGNIAPKDIDIQDFTLLNASGDGTEKICLINAQGMDDGEYTWYGDWAPYGAGWYNGFERLEGETFKAGAAYYIYCQGAGVQGHLPAVL